MQPRLQRGVRVTLIGMIVNSLLAAMKLIAGVLGNSHALVADGVESIADLFSSVIVWRGMVIAAAPADPEHPYGHGKAEPLAAAAVATLLLVAAGWIALQSVHEIAQPHESPRAFTLYVLLGVVVIKESLFRWVLREGVSIESLAIRTDAWHHRSDALTSVAAGVGITVALLGGPGFSSADDYAALLASGVIGWNGGKLLRSAVDDLMDAAPPPEVVSAIRRAGKEVSGVCDVEKCVVRRAGVQVIVEMHVEVDAHMTVSEAHRIAHEVKEHVRERVPQVLEVIVHMEPALPPRPRS